MEKTEILRVLKRREDFRLHVEFCQGISNKKPGKDLPSANEFSAKLTGGYSMHCKNCKYWDVIDGEKVGGCTSPKFFKGYRYEYEDIMPDGVMLEHDEGWGMLTASLFGCIHFRKKKQIIS